jgi:hypothetical protein
LVPDRCGVKPDPNVLNFGRQIPGEMRPERFVP